MVILNSLPVACDEDDKYDPFEERYLLLMAQLIPKVFEI